MNANAFLGQGSGIRMESGLRIDIHHHIDEPRVGMVLDALDDLRAVLRRIEEKLIMASAEVERLRSEVAEAKTVQESAIVLLQGLAARIRELKEDPAALSALAGDLDNTTNRLAEAIEAIPQEDA